MELTTFVPTGGLHLWGSTLPLFRVLCRQGVIVIIVIIIVVIIIIILAVIRLQSIWKSVV